MSASNLSFFSSENEVQDKTNGNAENTHKHKGIFLFISFILNYFKLFLNTLSSLKINEQNNELIDLTDDDEIR